MAINKETEASPAAQKEEETLKFWEENKIFEKSLEKEAPEGEFVFYEGPPTANGLPGVHHFYQRAFKDAIPRYKTMRGFHVRRKAGWDTHGLPVELQVEKKLGLNSKKAIEEYGVEKFNRQCKESVWEYVDKWRSFSERMAFWLDYDDSYITYKPSYIESVWNVVKNANDQKLLYKDYKVVPWCPRCGTALSSHELAQGYKDVKDLSVTVELRLKGRPDTSLLAWTTTPWTLPGNVALAVGKDINYVEIEKKDGGDGDLVKFILAKDRLEAIFGNDEYRIVKEFKGKELVGLEYEPLYPFLKENIAESQKDKLQNAFKVYETGFVTTEDGTGIVHTAVMYGQDDFELGTKVNLPKQHLVDETGKFVNGTGFLEGRFVKDEDVAVDIIKDLAARNLLFSKEKYEHSYPFCWRCGTPLIYYARDSWYIRMSDKKMKDKLIEENEKINWQPEYIREGRFGEWLKDIKDWAISRERYWGTPLPVWQSEDGESKVIIGSVGELKKHTVNNGNKFIFLRHGEAQSNVEEFHTCDENADIHLTEKGKGEVKDSAKKLKSKKVSAVYSSPFLRTKETADIVCKELGLDAGSITFDKRIREFDFGDFNNKPRSVYTKFWQEKGDGAWLMDLRVPGGESYLDAKKRFGDFVYDIDSRHKNETILVITHGIGIEVAPTIFEPEKSGGDIIDQNPPLGGIWEYNFVPLPHDENFEFDLHRPFIDEVVLEDKKGNKLKRTKEVMDVWLDSGSMPFAQDHYPFSTKKILYPADYICEGLDQTRGWFYTLHAVGNIMGFGKAYKNVICLGILLDKDGQKMSKSKGNVVDPQEQMNKFSADALRFWMYTINQPGDSKNFDEKTVDEVVKKVFNPLTNTLAFYDLYADKSVSASNTSKNILDRWVLAELSKLISELSRELDNYNLFAVRMIRDFVADLSQWYVRRSRDRFKSDSGDLALASATLRYVLVELSKLMAPFTPFIAEEIYQKLKENDGALSVHLEKWPKEDKLKEDDEQLIEFMKKVREVVSKGMEARMKAGIKVRQPLFKLTLKDDTLKNKDDLIYLIKDEVNIKEVLFDKTITEDALLDANITDDLKKEGDARELMRAIQDLRKERGLMPNQSISLKLKVNSWGKEVINKHREEILKNCSASDISVEPIEGGQSWFAVDF